MAVSRRHFIRQVVAIGPVTMVFLMEADPLFGAECGLPATGQDCTLPTPPPATRYIPNEPKVRTRYSAGELATSARATQLQWLRDGICAIRNLPPNDVLSWTKFVAQHCINCASSNSNNIHYNWQFLPWHRALLYLVEKTARKLTGQDDLRLCYWDWENAASRVIPSIYTPANQPLYWANRGPASRWPINASLVNVQGLLATPTFVKFGGTATIGNPTPASYVGPHANVHNNFSPGDMSNLQYSPRDPVFYAHHGNIDRLWSSWIAASTSHTNPEFGTAKVYFYDETRTWRYILMNDLKDTKKLGYLYSSLMKPTVALANLRTSTAAKTANKITLAAAARESVPKAGPDFLVITNIRNLDRLPTATVTYGIFVGNPPAGTDAKTNEGFLGVASRVASEGHAAHANQPLSVSLEVTDKLAPQAAKRSNTLDLFVAPLDLNLKTTGPAIPLEADEVQVVS